MKPFARHFAVEDLAENVAIRRLFARWALPGEVCDAQRCLRNGIRVGYLSLYVRGQSVARVYQVGGTTRLAVQPVYVAGHKRNAFRSSDLDKRTATFDSDRVSASQIDSWIEIAETYAGSEKAFVDDLVAHNAGALDLEMGLPANTAERTAPRMDWFWRSRAASYSGRRNAATTVSCDPVPLTRRARTAPMRAGSGSSISFADMVPGWRPTIASARARSRAPIARSRPGSPTWRNGSKLRARMLEQSGAK